METAWTLDRLVRLTMEKNTIKYDCLLLLTAFIWGFGFVAQRSGMEYIGPYLFNGIRFALGSFVLIPLLFKEVKKPIQQSPDFAPINNGMKFLAGIFAGIILFSAASFQQVGLVYTTAGNAGFITGLYVIIVPILGIFLGTRPGPGNWTGAILASFGLYLLCIKGSFSTSFGDILQLAGAFLWAIHVLFIGWISPRSSPILTAFMQFATCSVFSLVTAFYLEDISIVSIFNASIPLIYGGALSVGVGYTLQVVAQTKSKPTHAAIILSLEGAFAALGGWLILGEVLSPRGIAGCCLMLSGMIISQLWALLQVWVNERHSKKNI